MWTKYSIEGDIALWDNYVDNLFSLTGSWLKSGLDHMRTYLQEKWNPHHALKIFHVAGTNWKWSVCHMLSQVLHKQFHKKVWLFTSPHLVHISERIQINSIHIPHDRLNSILKDIYQETKEFWEFSYFEILTLSAIRYFIQEKVEYAIFEVGLWWTLDSTNVRVRPVATYITSIGLDHKRLLWPSLSQIQWNKMGIMKSWVPCYTSVDNGLMCEWARRKNAILHIIQEWVPTSLSGAHQEINAGLVYASLCDLGFDEKKIKKWLLDISHSWRLEYIAPNILVDGAHNKQWLEALGRYISEIRDNRSHIITVFGTSKSLEEVKDFTHICIDWDENILLMPSVWRWLDPKAYSDLIAFDTIVEEWDPKDFVDRLCSTLDNDTLLLVYGSLYLIWELYPVLQKYKKNSHNSL